MRILNKREWPYQFAFKQNMDIGERIDWSIETFGKENVNFTINHMCFKRAEDATYYAIRWGGDA